MFDRIYKIECGKHCEKIILNLRDMFMTLRTDIDALAGAVASLQTAVAAIPTTSVPANVDLSSVAKADALAAVAGDVTAIKTEVVK